MYRIKTNNFYEALINELFMDTFIKLETYSLSLNDNLIFDVFVPRELVLVNSLIQLATSLIITVYALQVPL